MIRLLSLILGISSVASAASDPFLENFRTQQMLQAQMMNSHSAPSLHPMRVYLKGGSKNPPLDSFFLVAGEPEIWRHEHEDAFFKKGEKISHKLSDLDSVVLVDGGMAFPAPDAKHMLFLQEAGAITYYGSWPKAKGEPSFLRKGDGEILTNTTEHIQDLVGDDPEAKALIDRYASRWVWKGGIMAAGALLVGGGLAIAAVTDEEDAKGNHVPTTPVAAALIVPGLIGFVVPLTHILDFIWYPLPKRSLDKYNRDHAAAP